MIEVVIWENSCLREKAKINLSLKQISLTWNMSKYNRGCEAYQNRTNIAPSEQ